MFGWNVLARADLPAATNNDDDPSGADRLATASSFFSDEHTALFNYPRIALQTRFRVSLGLRRDDFNWSIAATDRQPDVLSELTWSDVKSHQLAIANQSILGRHVYLRFNFNYARIADGCVRDSDYAGNNRTDEYSRSISQSDGDYLFDFSMGAGYPFTFFKGNLMVVPLIGGSLHKQNFRISDGYQVISNNPNDFPVGPLPSQLSSTYRAKWEGYWLGCDLQYDFQPKSKWFPPMQWSFSLEYHWTRYAAKADWNLRSDLDHPVSFEQDADGHGLSLQGQWAVAVTSRLNVTLTLHYLKWTTDPGNDRFNHVSHPQSRRFNGAEWESRGMMVGVAYRFL
jgi:hypothetical protein